MNKKIKIIELLQDFADEKEIIMPKYVRYLDRNTNEKAIMLVCQENIIDKLDKKMIKLNDYVEILEDNTEDNTEEIEELFDYRTGENDLYNDNFDDMFRKINELVKAYNKIRKDMNK